MKNLRSILALLLCLVMCLSLLPVSVFANELEEAPTGDDSLGAPQGSAILNDNEVSQGLKVPESERVRVVFNCEPENLTLTVYTLDQEKNQQIIEPEEANCYLLLPGEYFYDAECEGYEAATENMFNIPTGEPSKYVSVVLFKPFSNDLSSDEVRAAAVISIDSYTDGYKNYSNGQYYQSLLNAKGSLSGNGAADIVRIAQSQVDCAYPESAYWCFGVNKGWCNAFVAWCAYQAGISGDVVAGADRSMRDGQYSYGIGKMISLYQSWGVYTSYSASSYISDVKAGDILFLDGEAHVCIVENVSGETINCIDGNWGNSVRRQPRSKNNSYNQPGENGVRRITGLARPKYVSAEILKSYPCDLTVETAVNNCSFWSMPGNNETYPESHVVGKMTQKGMTFHATSIIENKVPGHYWYETTFPTTGTTCYVWINNTNNPSQNWTVSASGVNKPGNLTLGQFFDVRGTVSTGGTKITKLRGYIYPGNSTSGTPNQTSDEVSPNSAAYDLRGIDLSMYFDRVSPAGYYTYTVKVNLSGYTISNGKPVEQSKSNVVVSDITTYYKVGAASNTISVTLNANGGSCSTGSLSYNAGDSLGDLPTPTMPDSLTPYRFDGWYTEGGTLITSSTPINNNMTLYAHWIHDPLFGKINFDTAGGSFQRIGENEASSYSHTDYETGEVKSYSSYAAWLADNKYIYTASPNSTDGRYFELPVPTRNGYLFNGWYNNDYSGYRVRYYTGFGGLNLVASWIPYNIDEARPTYSLTYGDHTYEVYDYNLSWTQAKAFCEAKGGHLVTITSQDEQNKVKELLSLSADVNGTKNGIYSIGATDAGSEGSWKWVTGEPFSYQNWDVTGGLEPSGGTAENYSAIVAQDYAPNKVVGEWVDSPDVDCSAATGKDFYGLGNQGFICEYEQFSVASGEWGELEWVVDSGGTLTISGSGPMKNGAYFESGNWTDHKKLFNKVVIKEGVTTIGNFAFVFGHNITSVSLPDSLTSIGNAAFLDCTNLTEIDIPTHVTSIKSSVFYGCSSLADIYVAPDNQYYSSLDGVLFDKASTTLLCCPGGKSGVYQVPDTVTCIDDGAFYYCSGLTGITLPADVTSIGSEAFYNCSGLTGITLPAGVTSIGSEAFANCSHLKEITLPANVMNVDAEVFYGSSALKDIHVEEDNQYFSSIDGVLLNKAATVLIRCPEGKNGAYQIPDKVTTIGEYAFESCNRLTSITLPARVTSIGEYAFDDCNFNEVCFGGSESQRNERQGAGWCTDGNSALFDAQWSYVLYSNTLTIPAGTKTIESEAFADLTQGVNIVIPDTVHSIAADAFQNSRVIIIAKTGSYAQLYAGWNTLAFIPLDD